MNSRPICAEQVAISTAYAAGYSKVIGMVVVGEPQADENGHHYPTLHPCAECRAFMQSHPLIRPHTLIVTETPPVPEAESQKETHTFQELLQLYGETQ